MLHIFPRPHQITQRFLRAVRDPDGSQFAGPVQACQSQAIAPVRLDPIPSFLRNQRRRDDQTLPTQIPQLPINAVSTGAGFVTERQVRSTFPQLPD